MAEIYFPDELNLIPPPSFLIRPSIPEGLTVIFGDTNIGKTFLSVAAHASISTGQPQWYGGHMVEAPRRHTLYVASEGNLSALNQRIYAWCAHYGIDPAETFKYLGTTSGPVNLLDVKSIQGLLEDFKARRGVYPVLTTFDTLNMSMSGDRMDENDNAQMGQAVQNLRSIIYPGGNVHEEPQTSIDLVHHSGHNDKLRYRGASALGAAADSMIGMSYFDPSKAKRDRFVAPDPYDEWMSSAGGASRPEPSFYRYVWNAKTKDIGPWEPKILKLEKVVYARIGMPERGKGTSPVRQVEESRVLVENVGVNPFAVTTADGATALPGGLSSKSRRVVKALQELSGSASLEQVVEQSGLATGTVRNAFTELTQQDLIERSGNQIDLILPRLEEPESSYDE